MSELKVNVKQGVLGPALELILHNKSTDLEAMIPSLNVTPIEALRVVDRLSYLADYSAAVRMFGGFEFNGEWFNTNQQVEGEPWCHNCGSIARSPKMRYYNKKPHCTLCLLTIGKKNRGYGIQLLGDDYKG